MKRSGNWTEIQNLSSLLHKWEGLSSSQSMGLAKIRILNEVRVGGQTLPIHGLILGPDDKSLPTFGLFGGVHGLERVGTHVVLNYLSPLIEQLRWDETLRETFQKMRLVSIPIINPGGMYLGSRANPNGVDVMRNAPVDVSGEDLSQLHPIVSGHRISRRLPWYRGQLGAPMEIETQTLIQFVKDEMLKSEFSLALDVHSGFGARDHLWWPYSRSRTEKFPHLDVVEKFRSTLQSAHPFHVYVVEPQSASYLINGDPWDYIFDEHIKMKNHSIFIPWCLEMGSWTWLKKNPKQLFFRGGIFNPILPHRYKRIMRRHRPLLDLMRQLTLHHKNWCKNGETGVIEKAVQ